MKISAARAIVVLPALLLLGSLAFAVPDSGPLLLVQREGFFHERV